MAKIRYGGAGRADAGLVNAAFKVGATTVAPIPKGLKPINKAMMDADNKIQNTITDAMTAVTDTILEAQKDRAAIGAKQYSEFKTAADNTIRRLSTIEKGGQEGGLATDFFDVTYDKVMLLKQQFADINTTGKNDTIENKKERERLFATLNVIKNNVLDARATALTVAKTFDNINQEMMSPNRYSAISAAIDQDATNVVRGWNEKNEIVYTVTLDDGKGGTIVEEFTNEELNKDIIYKNHATETSYEAALQSYYTEGLMLDNNPAYKEFDGAEALKDVKKDLLREEHDLADFSTKKLFNGKSYRDILLQNPTISQVSLDALLKQDQASDNPIGLDISGDGKLTIEDFLANTEIDINLLAANKQNIIEALTNPAHPNYNHQLAQEEFGAMIVKNYKNRHDNARRVRDEAERERINKEGAVTRTYAQNQSVKNFELSMKNPGGKIKKGSSQYYLYDPGSGMFGLHNHGGGGAIEYYDWDYVSQDLGMYMTNTERKKMDKLWEAHKAAAYSDDPPTTEVVEEEAEVEEVVDNDGIKALKDEEVVSIRFFGGITSPTDIKKINGVWHRDNGHVNQEKWEEVSKKELIKIQKLYK
jgi:hypothetical protein